MEKYREDVFLFGSDCATWLYYNPDSTAGGQFVEILLPYWEIVEMAPRHPDAEAFFRYWLDNPKPQYLVDIDHPAFEATAAEYNAATIRGCTSETRWFLVEVAKEMLKNG